MTEKFGKKYRTKTVRAGWWDYANDGAYFVTICTKNKEHFFGKIPVGALPVETPNLGVSTSTNIMQLNDIGKIAHQFLAEIPTHFPFVYLDEFVVMPNHVHAIIGICKSPVGVSAGVPVKTPNWASLPTTTAKNPNHKKNCSSGSLGVIVNQYKRICTIHAKKTNPHFAWQPRFYDRIIRNDDELAKIRNYVHQNPERWHCDRNNDGGIWM